jgi:hypothetical protein
VIPLESFDVAQEQIAKPKAPVALAAGQSDQPISNLGILITELGLIPVARPTDV